MSAMESSVMTPFIVTAAIGALAIRRFFRPDAIWLRVTLGLLTVASVASTTFAVTGNWWQTTDVVPVAFILLFYLALIGESKQRASGAR